MKFMGYKFSWSWWSQVVCWHVMNLISERVILLLVCWLTVNWLLLLSVWSSAPFPQCRFVKAFGSGPSPRWKSSTLCSHPTYDIFFLSISAFRCFSSGLFFFIGLVSVSKSNLLFVEGLLGWYLFTEHNCTDAFQGAQLWRTECRSCGLLVYLQNPQKLLLPVTASVAVDRRECVVLTQHLGVHTEQYWYG